MSSSAPAWVTSMFCPILGTIIGNIMWLSPMQIVTNVRSSNDLGTLNPIPFGITVINCIGWSMYGCMKRDYFIFWGNMPGLVLGLFYAISVLPFLCKKNPTPSESLKRMMMEGMIVGGTFFWAFIAMMVFIIMSPEERTNGEMIVGYLSCGFALMYYASPLSTMGQVISTRDASSLYVPMIVTNLANALLWSSYGFFGLQDPVVWGPNVLGVTLSTIQLSLSIVFHPVSFPLRIFHAIKSCGGLVSTTPATFTEKKVTGFEKEEIYSPLQTGKNLA